MHPFNVLTPAYQLGLFLILYLLTFYVFPKATLLLPFRSQLSFQASPGQVHVQVVRVRPTYPHDLLTAWPACMRGYSRIAKKQPPIA